jgi:hypothetical protein
VTHPQRPRTAPTGTVGQQQPPDGPQSVCGASQGHRGAQDGLLVALPWPPTVNTYYRHVIVHGHARVLISAAGRQYAQAVGVLLAGLRDRAPAPPHAVSIALHAPNRARIDLDNRAKGRLPLAFRRSRRRCIGPATRGHCSTSRSNSVRRRGNCERRSVGAGRTSRSPRARYDPRPPPRLARPPRREATGPPARRVRAPDRRPVVGGAGLSESPSGVAVLGMWPPAR